MTDSRSHKIFTLYLWFASLFYLISFLGGGGVKFRDNIPHSILISRDIVWIIFIVYLGYSTNWKFMKKEFWHSAYGKFLKIFAALSGSYFVIALTHLFHKEAREIVQHDLRNILSYSLILIFLPFVFRKREDVSSLTGIFLHIGLVLSIFGIVTRYVPFDSLTWEGRIVSTMSDPNNLGILLFFCILLLVALWESFSYTKAILYFGIYCSALVLTNSVTALVTACSALFVMFVFKKGCMKGFIFFLLTFYFLLSLSLMIKAIENPDKLSGHFLKETYSTDKYLIDRLNNMSNGYFNKVFLPGLEFPSPSAMIRSVTYRKAQILSVISGENEGVKELTNVKKMLTLFGDFKLKKYSTLDNQYLNFLINTGIVSIIIFFSLFVWGGATGIKNYFKYYAADRKLAEISLFFSIFLLSMTLVGFNGAAFLNRFPLNLYMYLSLGMVFLIQGMQNTITEWQQ